MCGKCVRRLDEKQQEGKRDNTSGKQAGSVRDAVRGLQTFKLVEICQTRTSRGCNKTPEIS